MSLDNPPLLDVMVDTRDLPVLHHSDADNNETTSHPGGGTLRANDATTVYDGTLGVGAEVDVVSIEETPDDFGATVAEHLRVRGSQTSHQALDECNPSDRHNIGYPQGGTCVVEKSINCELFR